MALPPEVVLHRFFHRQSLAVRQKYEGKQDLEKLEPGIRSLLIGIQETLNESLRQQQGEPFTHAKEANFHFDYLQATIPNALAFGAEGYSFILVTMPLVRRLWQVCDQLSRSAKVIEILKVATTDQQREATLAGLFATQLSFIVAHEYAHHVRGHFFQSDSGTEFWNEILHVSGKGSLSDQAREVDADGLAVYVVLTHMLVGQRREHALKLLGHSVEKNDAADQVLLSSFILSVGAYFYVGPPAVFNNDTLYTLTHPPQAARMNEIMHNVQAWCKQNRPALEAWLTLERFQLLMAAAAEATLGTTGASNWSEQTKFFSSARGAEYFMRLHKRQHQLLSHIDPGPAEESEAFVRAIYDQRRIDASSDGNGQTGR